MIRINLLPVRALKKKESVRQTVSILALSLGLVVLVILLFHLTLANKIHQVETQIAAYHEEIRKLKIDTKDVEKFKAERDDLQRRLNVIYTLQRAKTGPVRVLDDLVTAVPEKLWLTAVKEKGGKMEIRGVAMDNPTIAKFMTNLEKSGVIRNIELVVSQQIDKKVAKVKEFALTCEVHYGSSSNGPTS